MLAYRFALAIFAYLTAFIAIYGGFQLAPNMTWPATSIEYVAANLLVIGMSAKCLGHVLLLVRN